MGGFGFHFAEVSVCMMAGGRAYSHKLGMLDRQSVDIEIVCELVDDLVHKECMYTGGNAAAHPGQCADQLWHRIRGRELHNTHVDGELADGDEHRDVVHWVVLLCEVVDDDSPHDECHGGADGEYEWEANELLVHKHDHGDGCHVQDVRQDALDCRSDLGVHVDEHLILLIVLDDVSPGGVAVHDETRSEQQHN